MNVQQHEAFLQVGIIVGDGIAPYDRMLTDLALVMPRYNPQDHAEAFDTVAAYFQPAEDNPGQIRQARDRRRHAVRWANAHPDTPLEWLLEVGVDPSEPFEDADAAAT